jgi:hypothetical protein
VRNHLERQREFHSTVSYLEELKVLLKLHRLSLRMEMG